MYVTPRCAAAAVVSAVVLRRQRKEYTHPYSMMHRRLPTAGIEVAPHYHQLLVTRQPRELRMLSAQKFKCTRRFFKINPDCLRTYSMSPCQAVDQRFSFSPEFLGFGNAILCLKKRRFRQL